MNPQFLLKFIHRFHNRGSTLPAVLGLGLIMTLAAGVMMIRSGDDEIHSASQAQASESVAVAEAGITQVIDLLNQYPDLLKKNAVDWDAEEDTRKLTCDLENDTREVPAEKVALIENASEGNPAWIESGETDTSTSEFRIVSFDHETGFLKIEGRTKAKTNGNGNGDIEPEEGDPNGGAGSDPTIKSHTTLEVKVVPQTPGIWVPSDDGSGIPPVNIENQRSINANIWVEGCSYDRTRVGPNSFVKDGEEVRPLPNGLTPTATGSLQPIPPLPVPPPNAYRLPPLSLYWCYATLPRIQRDHQNSDCGDAGSYLEGGLGINRNFPDIVPEQYDEILNRTDDVPVNGVYSYIIKNPQAENYDDTSSDGPRPRGELINRSINLVDSQLYIDPPPGTKVVLYLEGDAVVSPNSIMWREPPPESPTCEGNPGPLEPDRSVRNLKINAYLGPMPENNQNGSPSKLEIYGADGSGSWGGDFKFKHMEIGVRGMVSGFLYAPAANIIITSGEMRGAIWSKSFRASPTRGLWGRLYGPCKISVAQQDVGDNLLVEIPKRVGAIAAWRRQSQ